MTRYGRLILTLFALVLFFLLYSLPTRVLLGPKAGGQGPNISPGIGMQLHMESLLDSLRYYAYKPEGVGYALQLSVLLIGRNLPDNAVALARHLCTAEGIDSFKLALADSLVRSPYPMKGIFLLRSMVEQDPEHREALTKLALLSMQSRQYSKAKERFLQILLIQKDDYESMIYLGFCYESMGEPDSARMWLQKVASAQGSPEWLKVLAKNHLSSLNT